MRPELTGAYMFTKAKMLLITATVSSLAFTSQAQAAGGMYILSSAGTNEMLINAVSLPASGNRLAIPIEKACLAIGLYHEARGETEVGQTAVGLTILNRVRSTAYPDTICGVVYQNAHRMNGCQFSFACDTLSDVTHDRRAYARMDRLARTLIRREANRKLAEGPIGHSGERAIPHVMDTEYTHYHRHDVHPSWSRKLHSLGRIGKHVFFRSERVVRRYATIIQG